VLFFWPVVLSFNVLLDAHPRQWPAMTGASAVGTLVSFLSSQWLSSDSASVVSSFAVGIVSAAYARFRNTPPLITTLNGILMLVPGGLGVKGATALVSGDLVSGVAFGLNMLVIGMSISTGLFMAKAVIPFRPAHSRFTLL